MKTCPVCGAKCFDDMETCFGCLHSFTEKPMASASDCAPSCARDSVQPVSSTAESSSEAKQFVPAVPATTTVPAMMTVPTTMTVPAISVVSKSSDCLSAGVQELAETHELTGTHELAGAQDSEGGQGLAGRQESVALKGCPKEEQQAASVEEVMREQQPSLGIATPDGWVVQVQVADFSKGVVVYCNRVQTDE